MSDSKEWQLVGKSTPMNKIKAKISKIARNRGHVLLLGETGTGKNLIARELHRLSERTGDLVELDCPNLPPNIAESEMFGYMKGSHSGAATTKEGLFHAAHEGTLFIDEIGELSLKLQAKLLKVVDEKRFKPVGPDGLRTEVDIRIIAATNRNLPKEVAEKRFRQDLYKRLEVFVVNVPPLRDRRDDIPDLVRYFVKIHDPSIKVSDAALQALRAHHWPGNVRELSNMVERAVGLSDTKQLTREHFQFPHHKTAMAKTTGRHHNERVREFVRSVIAIYAEKGLSGATARQLWSSDFWPLAKVHGRTGLPKNTKGMMQTLGQYAEHERELFESLAPDVLQVMARHYEQENPTNKKPFATLLPPAPTTAAPSTPTHPHRRIAEELIEVARSRSARHLEFVAPKGFLQACVLKQVEDEARAAHKVCIRIKARTLKTLDDMWRQTRARLAAAGVDTTSHYLDDYDMVESAVEQHDCVLLVNGADELLKQAGAAAGMKWLQRIVDLECPVIIVGMLPCDGVINANTEGIQSPTYLDATETEWQCDDWGDWCLAEAENLGLTNSDGLRKLMDEAERHPGVYRAALKTFKKDGFERARRKLLQRHKETAEKIMLCLPSAMQVALGHDAGATLQRGVTREHPLVRSGILVRHTPDSPPAPRVSHWRDVWLKMNDGR